MFYRTNEPYGCFSNFAPFPININSIEWLTTEHYFQSQKFTGTQYEEEIRLIESPAEAARAGRDRNKPLRKDWHIVKDEIMYTAIRAKVEQHSKIKEILISTGNCILVEHTTNDSYWADNGDGTGLNMLGKILMDVRKHLQGYTEEFYLPQWIAYPNIHPYDMFWRMGVGESYTMNYGKWFYSLSTQAQKEYNRYFTPPKEWEGINDL